MKRSILGCLFLCLLTCAAQADSWRLNVTNINGAMRVSIAGTVVLRCDNTTPKCAVDLDPYLEPGYNYLQLVLNSTGGSWSYHFRLTKDGVDVFSGKCGTAAYGCMGNQQFNGQVFETNVPILK